MGRVTVAGRRMKRAQGREKMGRRLSRGAAAAVIASALALQPCFSFISQAYTDSYGYSNELDDAGDYYYDENGERVYVTNVTRTYEDGTSYVAEYRYDSQKRLISANIKREDGSKTTESRQYIEDHLASVSTYHYDASTKEEANVLNEYNEQEMLMHSVERSQYPDGTSESKEVWYQGYRQQPVKVVSTDRDGVTMQADLAYDENGNLTMGTAVLSDGSREELEYQYDEAGEEIYQRTFEYDAAAGTSLMKEWRYLGEEPGQGYYVVETATSSDGQVYKTETWESGGFDKSLKIKKRVVTNPDGSQVIEDYTYNSDGKETLYVKSDGDGMIERRETDIRNDGFTEVDRDRDGNVHTVSKYYDVKTNLVTMEEMDSYADGRYHYEKYTYHSDSYRNKSRIIRERTADGKETETEEAYNDEGELIHDRTRYPEGVEIQSAYEYGPDGELIKITETRENGISAVTQYQTNEADGSWWSAERTFSNGYQMTVLEEWVGAYNPRYTYTYSTGEVAQDIITIGGEADCLTTVYRDGRTEEISSEYINELVAIAQAHLDEFNRIAWEMPSVQVEALMERFGTPELGYGVLSDLRQD